jgi:hypothetical protein
MVDLRGSCFRGGGLTKPLRAATSAWAEPGNETMSKPPAALGHSGRDRLLLAAATFAILATELALIRWFASQVRLFAYFSNIVLISAFLGMGIGILLGRTRPWLIHLALPVLALLSLILGFSFQLGLWSLSFPDISIYLWTADTRPVLLTFLRNLGIMLALFWLMCLVFVCAGAAVGHYFSRLEPLEAYSWDLGGSLFGILVFMVITWLSTPPPVWLLPGVIALALLSRRWYSWVAGAVVIGAAWFSIDGALFSPYNRIDYSEDRTGKAVDHVVVVNRDYHQWIRDLRPAVAADPALDQETRDHRRMLQIAYDIPFVINPERDRALIVGAGTGNDVSAALRNGYGECLSVDIDGRLIELGRRLHPEQPYSDPRVRPIINDARAFFEQYRGEPFDVVCYGLLDSHAMFSAMSTLRLDNYVYTVEDIRAAWRHVAEDGHLSVSFSVYAGDWLADRLYWTIAEATGRRPTVLNHGMDWGYAFIVPRDGASLNFEPLAALPRVEPSRPREETRVCQDDWPFLYIRPGVFPIGYVVLISMILLTGLFAVRRVMGIVGSSRFDLPMFLMGAAFLLLETRGVTNLSLLFGSTWVVNASVFAGILLIVLLANILVQKGRVGRIGIWQIVLLISVILLAFFRPSWLAGFDIASRGLLGGLVNAIPVGIAGIVVSQRLQRARDPVTSLGSNLLGAIVGGSVEYLSMWIGLQAVALVVFGLYAVAIVLIRREV